MTLCMATLTTSSFAQQNIFNAQAPMSPEVNTDKTVTFRIMAPEAQKVQVTGDFLPTQKVKTPHGEYDVAGIADLNKDAKGLWTYTTKTPLKPELYQYNMVVDGVKVADPSNVYVLRDVANVASIFFIDGGRADLYKVNNVPHGTVSKIWYDSPTAGTTRRCTDAPFTPPRVMKRVAKNIPCSIFSMVWAVTNRLGRNSEGLYRYSITSLLRARQSP